MWIKVKGMTLKLLQLPLSNQVPSDFVFAGLWPQGSICLICTGGQTHEYNFQGGGNKISH